MTADPPARFETPVWEAADGSAATSHLASRADANLGPARRRILVPWQFLTILDHSGSSTAPLRRPSFDEATHKTR